MIIEITLWNEPVVVDGNYVPAEPADRNSAGNREYFEIDAIYIRRDEGIFEVLGLLSEMKLEKGYAIDAVEKEVIAEIKRRRDE